MVASMANQTSSHTVHLWIYRLQACRASSSAPHRGPDRQQSESCSLICCLLARASPGRLLPLITMITHHSSHQWMAKLAWSGSYTAKRPSHHFVAWRELQRIPKSKSPQSLCLAAVKWRSTTLGQAQPHTQARTAPRKLYKESKLLSNRHR